MQLSFAIESKFWSAILDDAVFPMNEIKQTYEFKRLHWDVNLVISCCYINVKTGHMKIIKKDSHLHVVQLLFFHFEQAS